MKRVLFVCMGNICRSPAAEIVFRKIVDDAGLSESLEIDSAGTIGYHAGNPPDSRMSDHLRRRGYEITGRSRPVTSEDLDIFDLILTMDEENQADVLRLGSSGNHKAEIVPFVTYLREHSADRIPDPYHGGDKGFAHVIDLVVDGCVGLLDEFSKK